MNVTYFGHSAVQIEEDGAITLIDPFISGNSWTEGVVEPGDLHPDNILLTHAHGDHWGDTASIAERSGAQVVGCFEIIQYLARKHDYHNGIGANTGGRVELEWGSVFFTHARHSSSFPDGTYGGLANGLVIDSDSATVYHAGDTALFPDMEWIGDQFDIDLAFIPIGDLFTMGPEDSLVAIEMVEPRIVVPVHYNTFPPIELPDEVLEDWSAAVRDLGVEPLIMDAGDTVEL